MDIISESKAVAKRKAPVHAFKKGQSGNPGGRKAKTEEERTLEQMCREKTPEALATILKIMIGGENERNKLTAANIILERGHGKARQEVTGVNGAAIQHALSIAVSFINADRG